MFLHRTLLENTNSRWIPFKKFPFMLFNETKVSWYLLTLVLERLLLPNMQSLNASIINKESSTRVLSRLFDASAAF